jgi:Ca-activated chloride channel homolog
MKRSQFLCVLLLAPTASFAQQQQELPEPAAPPPSIIQVPPPPAEEDPDAFYISTDVELVLLDVSVKGNDGGFVSGLTKDDFQVFEDKVKQELTVFSAKDVPVTVGLVVDNSGSVRPKKAEIVTAALTFVTNSNPRDEMFVVNFNDNVRMGLPETTPFTGDPKLLRSGLLANPAQGRTALYDAISTAIDHLAKGRLAKKTLVVVGDGGDNMSDITKRELIRRAENSLVTIYTVGIFNSRDKDKDPGFLRRLAKITGGEAFEPDDTENLVEVCEKIAKDIRNRYTVGYVPSNRNHDGKERKLKIIATSPEGKEYDVRTRTHYYQIAKAEERSRTNDR